MALGTFGEGFETGRQAALGPALALYNINKEKKQEEREQANFETNKTLAEKRLEMDQATLEERKAAQAQEEKYKSEEFKRKKMQWVMESALKVAKFNPEAAANMINTNPDLAAEGIKATKGADGKWMFEKAGEKDVITIDQAGNVVKSIKVPEGAQVFRTPEQQQTYAPSELEKTHEFLIKSRGKEYADKWMDDQLNGKTATGGKRYSTRLNDIMAIHGTTDPTDPAVVADYTGGTMTLSQIENLIKSYTQIISNTYDDEEKNNILQKINDLQAIKAGMSIKKEGSAKSPEQKYTPVIPGPQGLQPIQSEDANYEPTGRTSKGRPVFKDKRTGELVVK